MKRIGVGLAVLLLIVLIIPGMIALFGDKKIDGSPPPQIPLPSSLDNQIPIAVYRTENKKVDVVPIEEYMVGVLSAEMPADFELEALKAQAMAARTYIIRRIAGKNFSDVPKGAHVTDTIKHQVYMDDNQRKKAWGSDYDWKIQKVRQAVVETQGKVLTYDGKPIDATFFSTSNGYTENSEEYWAQKIPYLRSVQVPWDKQSPKYQWTKKIKLSDLEKMLGVKVVAAASAPDSFVKNIQKTTGNRVAKLQIGDITFTGRELREKLQLPSSSFDMAVQKGEIHITTFGYGHGVGMSQWGANGMAREGKKAPEIVKYFYQGIAIEDYHQWIPN